MSNQVQKIQSQRSFTHMLLAPLCLNVRLPLSFFGTSISPAYVSALLGCTGFNVPPQGALEWPRSASSRPAGLVRRHVCARRECASLSFLPPAFPRESAVRPMNLVVEKRWCTLTQSLKLNASRFIYTGTVGFHTLNTYSGFVSSLPRKYPSLSLFTLFPS